MRLTTLAIVTSLFACSTAFAQAQDESTDPNLAPAKYEKPPQTKALARQNRACINLSFGFGSAALDDVHEMADYYSDAIDAAYDPGKTNLDHDEIKGNLQINAEVGFTYYIPYYILAHVAFGAIYQKSSTSVLNMNVDPPVHLAEYENWNLLFEIPILVGGYYPFKNRF